VTYLTLESLPRWLHCAGGRALEETEATSEQAPRLGDPIQFATERKAALEALGAKVSLTRAVHIDIGVITGEDRASAVADTILIAEWEDHSRIEVYGHGLDETKLLTLAALVKYGLLHNVTEVGVCPTVEELYVFGQRVTEAGAIALSVRGDVSALSHLSPGDWCKDCRSQYRCPELNKVVHERVFGPLQALDEPKLTPVSVRQSLAPGESAREGLEAALKRIPMIEAWVSAVRAQAGLARGAKRGPKKGHKKRGRPRRAPSDARIETP
jgi:hypothetical protein